MRTSGTTMSLAAAAMIAISACTQEPADGISADPAREGRAGQTVADGETTGRDEQTETASDPQSLVDSAVGTVDRLRADRQAAALLRQAHGIFIIPKYVHAGLLVDGEGGQGVTLLKRGVAGSEALAEAGAAADTGVARWSGPVFYDFGRVTAGAEAGAEVGSIVLLLMSEQAAELFRTSQTDFSIDAGAGMAIFDFSARAEAAAGRGDIIVWTDTAGAFAGATIGIDGIKLDEDGTAAFYGTDIDAHRILNGERMNDRGQRLLDALTGAQASGCSLPSWGCSCSPVASSGIASCFRRAHMLASVRLTSDSVTRPRPRESGPAFPARSASETIPSSVPSALTTGMRRI